MRKVLLYFTNRLNICELYFIIEWGDEMGNYIVCFSPTGTTKKIATEISKGMKRPFELIDLSILRGRNKSLFFTKGDTVIIGAPVYAGRIPELVEKYYNLIDGGGATAIPVVVYGNRHYDDALLQLNDICKNIGFKTVAAGAFIGEHSYTKAVAKARPDTHDIKIAYEFGTQLTLNEKVLNIPGNRPYRELNKSLPIAPSTSESCIECGQCIETCPVEAVSKDNFESDENKCIKCHKCVKSCPVEAKYFDERLDHVRKWLVDNYTIRREPELFV